MATMERDVIEQVLSRKDEMFTLKQKESQQYIFKTYSCYFNKKVIYKIGIQAISKTTGVSTELGSVDMSRLMEDIYANPEKDDFLIIYQNTIQFILCKPINKRVIATYTLQEQGMIQELFQEAINYMCDYYETWDIQEIEIGE